MQPASVQCSWGGTQVVRCQPRCHHVTQALYSLGMEQQQRLCWRRHSQHQQPRRPRPRRRGSIAPQAAARRDPYEVLGVPRTASVVDLKKAFRRRALKLHPDVNKAADAKERFMECKEAYQELMKRRGGSSTAGSRSAGSAAKGSSPFGGSSSSSAGSSGYGRTQQSRPPPKPEEFYGFVQDWAAKAVDTVQEGVTGAARSVGDFFRDLEGEISDFSKRRREKRSAAGTAEPESLWEELFDLGDEFVEFLEQGLNVSDDEAAAYSELKRQYGDLSGGRPEDGSGSSQGPAAGGGAARGAGPSSGPSGSKGPTLERKPTAEYVEEELEALKRKLGKK